jgi:hypothetical protein
MALSNEEIDYLMRPDKIRTSHLSEEARDFRDKYLKGIYKQNRLMREHAKRKADMEGKEIRLYQYCDWNSDEEFIEWLHSDRIIRKKALDIILADDNWLEKLAKKYYGEDGWQVVYADKQKGVNWSREDDKKKKKLNKDEE